MLGSQVVEAVTCLPWQASPGQNSPEDQDWGNCATSSSIGLLMASQLRKLQPSLPQLTYAEPDRTWEARLGKVLLFSMDGLHRIRLILDARFAKPSTDGLCLAGQTLGSKAGEGTPPSMSGLSRVRQTLETNGQGHCTPYFYDWPPQGQRVPGELLPERCTPILHGSPQQCWTYPGESC